MRVRGPLTFALARTAIELLPGSRPCSTIRKFSLTRPTSASPSAPPTNVPSQRRDRHHPALTDVQLAHNQLIKHLLDLLHSHGILVVLLVSEDKGGHAVDAVVGHDRLEHAPALLDPLLVGRVDHEAHGVALRVILGPDRADIALACEGGGGGHGVGRG